MQQPEEDQALATLQASLLDLLDRHAEPAKLLHQLRSNPMLASYHAYIDTLEPRMIQVAESLVAKWGERVGDQE